jgi:glycosyltransferase involved in cell wall biosynthesis
MNFSIVICSHQPDPEVFRPVLQAISVLQWPVGGSPEIVLVDNASSEPLTDTALVRDWLARTPGARVVREERIGLSFARARAFREARGDWIVCFDDDNIPRADYLHGVLVATCRYPFVGVWGAGNIELKWLPGGDPKVASHYATVFQQRSQEHVTYALDFPLPVTMPYGTGMVLGRQVADRYVDWVESGKSRITDRRGAALSSAGDIQIGWLAMLSGWAVGRHPALALCHLIPARRAQMDYVARITFGAASSTAPALSEVIPNSPDIKRPDALLLVCRLLFEGFKWLTSSQSPPIATRVANHLGAATGSWCALGQSPPWWVRWLTMSLYGK